jgi:aminoglycoside phosphotransferase family enzyme/predicted kinase
MAGTAGFELSRSPVPPLAAALPPGVRVAETHSAIVLFFGDRAYKIKKPVDLGFLDFRDRATRERVCHREVELNRRLAPDVYEGVADLIGPDGTTWEHVVVMRRMPDDRRLSRVLDTDDDVASHLRHVAHQIATLHGRSRRGAEIDAAASRDALAERWRDNTSALLASAPVGLAQADIDAVHGLAMEYLEGRGALFEQRIRDGWAVDGHGDLLADDIFCLEDGPRILDCIEFDDHLRYGDGLADAAFLAMDLERLGHRQLADAFLRHYAELTSDTWPTSLAHHHIAYRAQVRAKVAAIRATEGNQQSALDARSLLDLARSHLEAGRVHVILVGGLPGTGKSTLAAELERRLGGTVLRSDVLRKELSPSLAANPDDGDFCTGLYAPHVTAATYARLLAEARIALGMGETVILDASWTDPRRRDEARDLARTAHAHLVELRCELRSDVAVERLRDRARQGTDASDATPRVAALMALHQVEWPGATAIDTLDRDVATRDALEAIRR